VLSVDLTFVGATADTKLPLVVVTGTGAGTVVCTTVASSASHCDTGAGNFAVTDLTGISVSFATTP
jgi:hypothetical protein